MTYSELVAAAVELHPDNEMVQNAIAVSVGRKLEVIKQFVAERELPDLSSLIISKSSSECGSGFGGDPVGALEVVAPQ